MRRRRVGVTERGIGAKRGVAIGVRQSEARGGIEPTRGDPTTHPSPPCAGERAGVRGTPHASRLAPHRAAAPPPHASRLPAPARRLHPDRTDHRDGDPRAADLDRGAALLRAHRARQGGDSEAGSQRHARRHRQVLRRQGALSRRAGRAGGEALPPQRPGRSDHREHHDLERGCAARGKRRQGQRLRCQERGAGGRPATAPPLPTGEHPVFVRSGAAPFSHSKGDSHANLQAASGAGGKPHARSSCGAGAAKSRTSCAPRSPSACPASPSSRSPSCPSSTCTK